MDKDFYTGDCNSSKRVELLNQFDFDINETLLHVYNSYCGTILMDTDNIPFPVCAFLSLSSFFLGKSIYDLYKLSNIDNKQIYNEPIKLKKIKEYK